MALFGSVREPRLHSAGCPHEIRSGVAFGASSGAAQVLEFERELHLGIELKLELECDLELELDPALELELELELELVLELEFKLALELEPELDLERRKLEPELALDHLPKLLV